jgi:hypothetical protein
MKQIGPNVSNSPNEQVGLGVRILSCIILDDVEIMVRFLACSQFDGYNLLYLLQYVLISSWCLLLLPLHLFGTLAG